jgi:hypothetical protein
MSVPITTSAPGCALQPTATDPERQAFNPNFERVGQTIGSAHSGLIETGTASQEQFALKIIFGFTLTQDGGM